MLGFEPCCVSQWVSWYFSHFVVEGLSTKSKHRPPLRLGAIFYASRLTEVMWRSVRQQDRAKTTLQNFMQPEAEVEQSLPCRQNAHALLLGENSRR